MYAFSTALQPAPAKEHRVGCFLLLPIVGNVSLIRCRPCQHNIQTSPLTDEPEHLRALDELESIPNLKPAGKQKKERGRAEWGRQG